MSTSQYRLTVIACALAWLLVGMHTPVVHQITRHGRMPGPGLLVVLVMLVLIAGGSVWSLLRTPRPHADPRS